MQLVPLVDNLIIGTYSILVIDKMSKVEDNHFRRLKSDDCQSRLSILHNVAKPT